MAVIEKLASTARNMNSTPSAVPHSAIGAVHGAVADDRLLSQVASHLPTVRFQPISGDAPPALIKTFDALIIPGDLGAGLEGLLAETAALVKTIVVLEDTSIAASRRLFSLGATDILPAPLTESALILSLERLIRTATPPISTPRPDGSVVAMLKAGGGVGASFLASQAAAQLARRNAGLVSIADLDIQFGAVAEYLDVAQSLTAADLVANPAAFSEAALLSALVEHASGCRILGAPKEVTPLESLGATHIETLVGSLRRTFTTSLLDLPSVWTQWSYRALQMADRIVLVTHLSVPHMQMVRRQLRLLAAQKLDDKPLTLVLNAVTGDQLAALSVKSAEKAIGRSIDLVIAEDARTANLAVNQGVEIQHVRRGAKLAVSIENFCSLVTDETPAPTATGGLNLKFW